MNCCCTSNILRSTATSAVSTSVLLLTPTNPLSPNDTQKVSIKVTTSTPTNGQSLPVNILFNGANVPVLNKYGNIVYGNELTINTVLNGYYGDNTPHYLVVNKRRHRC